MRIAVCFKIITDYDQVPLDNWKEHGLMRFPFVKKIFGFFDEGALETALRIKDNDSSIYLEAISFGKEDRIFTEALYSAGYDKVTYLNGKSDFSPKIVAETLGAYLEANSFDLILCGEMVGPNDSGSVPYLIASHISYDVINRVTEIGKDIVIRETESSIEEYALRSRLLLVISNAKYPYLRFGSFKDKEKAKEQRADIVPVSYGKNRIKLKKVTTDKRKVSLIEMSDLKAILAGGDPDES